MMKTAIFFLKCVLALIFFGGVVNVNGSCSRTIFTSKNSSWIISQLPNNFKTKVYHCQVNHVEKRFTTCDENNIYPNFINVTTINPNRTTCIEAIQSGHIFLGKENYTIKVNQNQPDHFVYNTICNHTTNISSQMSYSVRLLEYDGLVNLGKNTLVSNHNDIHCAYDNENCNYLDINLFWNLLQEIQPFRQLPFFVESSYSNEITQYLMIRNKNNLTYPLKILKRRKYNDVEFWLTDVSDIIVHSKYQNLSTIQNETYSDIRFKTEDTTMKIINEFCLFSIKSRNNELDNQSNNETNIPIFTNNTEIDLLNKVVFCICLIGTLIAYVWE